MGASSQWPASIPYAFAGHASPHEPLENKPLHASFLQLFTRTSADACFKALFPICA